MLPLWGRVDLGVMAIKGYFELPKGPSTPGLSRSGSDVSKQVHCIPGASLSDCLLSHPGHPLGESHPSTEM